MSFCSFKTINKKDAKALKKGKAKQVDSKNN